MNDETLARSPATRRADARFVAKTVRVGLLRTAALLDMPGHATGYQNAMGAIVAVDDVIAAIDGHEEAGAGETVTQADLERFRRDDELQRAE